MVEGAALARGALSNDVDGMVASGLARCSWTGTCLGRRSRSSRWLCMAKEVK